MKELSLVIVFRKARYSAWRPSLARCKQIRACANVPFAFVICFEVTTSQVSSLILSHPRRRIVTFALPDGRLFALPAGRLSSASSFALPDGRLSLFALPDGRVFALPDGRLSLPDGRLFALPAGRLSFALPDGRVALFVRCTTVGAELALTPPWPTPAIAAWATTVKR